MRTLSTISARILLTVALTVIGVIGFSSIIELYFIHQREKANFQQRINITSNRITNGLSYPLWNLNRAEAEKALINEMGSPDILAALVFDEHNRLYVGLIKDPANTLKARDSLEGVDYDLLSAAVDSITQEIVHKEAVIGAAKLYFTDAYLRAQIRELRLSVIFRILSLIVTLSLVMFIALQKLIVRPLNVLKKWVESMPVRSAAPPQFKRSLEINALAQAFGDMSLKLQHKRDELEIERANLELRVVQRTEELQAEVKEHQQTGQNLEKAKIAAEAANQAKSAFLANMSHELRTPLNGILGFAQILHRDATLTAEQKNGLRIIEKSGEHLLTLINDILDLSKIEADRLELQTDVFNLNVFLENILEMTRPRANSKTLELVVQKSTALPVFVRGDERRLRQVMLNLLGNAVKFTKQGRVTFIIEPESAGHIRFSIQDTGVGIPADRIDRLFEPFLRIDTPGQYVEGSGLGLAISRRLTRLMGGDLTIQSAPGQGSVFTVTAPLPETDQLSTTPAPTETRPVVGYQGERRRILIVDDKSDNRLLLLNLLTSLGFETLEADNGQAGIEQALAGKPDAILMDLVMPILDGYQTTRRLRENTVTRDMVIIAVSASAFEHDRQSSLAAGCTDFLPKPIQINDLLEQLRRYLRLEWVYEEAPVELIVPVGAAMVHPPKKRLDFLWQLAAGGDVMGIDNQLTELEHEDAVFMPFITKIRAMTADFDMKRIREFLENTPAS